MDKLSIGLLISLLMVAVWYDVRSRRIPNVLVLIGWSVGGLLSIWLDGSAGIINAVEGGVVGLVVLLPFYLMRTLGAGDVKLMAVVGVFLGPTEVLMVILGTFLAGGVMALAVAIHSGMLSRLLQNVKLMLFGAVVKISAGQAPHMDDLPESVGKLPYAVAITAGTLGYMGWRYLK
ncbi:MAG: prepilin peptidase [Sulfuriferula sp.]